MPIGIIRTLGFYQPYASLMLHGKVESRWVIKGKKPPFPLGKYLIYSTKKRYSPEGFKDIAGDKAHYALDLLKDEPTASLDGYALAVGDLVEIVPMTPTMELRAFIDTDMRLWESQDPITIDGRCLWGLVFDDVKRIKPFPFKGKQGVGFFRDRFKLEYL